MPPTERPRYNCWYWVEARSRLEASSDSRAPLNCCEGAVWLVVADAARYPDDLVR